MQTFATLHKVETIHTPSCFQLKHLQAEFWDLISGYPNMDGNISHTRIHIYTHTVGSDLM